LRTLFPTPNLTPAPAAAASWQVACEARSMELIACVSKDIVDLLPPFLANRQAEVAHLRAALVAHDWARIRDLAERMCAVGNPYGFRQITTFGGFMRQACFEQNVKALMELINAYSHYLSRVAVIEVEMPAPAKPDQKDDARPAE